MTRLKKAFSAAALFALMLAIGVTGLYVSARADGTSGAATGEIKPIALYEFSDADNIGKDTMGNYDMSFRNLWMAGGTGPLLDDFTPLAGGGISWTAEGTGETATGLCLSQEPGNHMFKDVTSFTLAFELQLAPSANWGHYVGVGNSAKNFAVNGSADGGVRAGLYGTGWTGIDSAAWDKLWLCDEEKDKEHPFHDIIISVQPGGSLNVWRDGVLVTAGDNAKTVPADWTCYDANSFFSIGAAYNGAAAFCSSGAMKNVAFYNFAMDDACAAAYRANGKVDTADVAGITRIVSAEVTNESFGDAGPASVPLNTSMSEADMFSKLNDATATVTLSNDETVTAGVTWTKVEKVDEKYYAVGEFSTSGLPYLDLLDSHEVRYELNVLSLTVGEPVFEGGVTKGELNDAMTEAEMIDLINQAKVKVIEGEAETEVTVTFSSVRREKTTYTAVGQVLYNGTAVGIVEVGLSVTETDTGDMKIFRPVAKWTFDSEETKLKDSMGKYDFGLAAKEGGNTEDPYGTGTVQDGRLYLSGNDVIALSTVNDVGDNINNGFTLNFQFQQDGLFADGDAWQSPVSFGFNDWNPSQCLHFLTSKGSEQLRYAACGITLTEQGTNENYWGPVVCENGTAKMHNVTVSVRPGEKLNVYVDGALVDSKDCPAGWNLENSNMSFAIGGSCVWGNGYNKFKGWVDNVSVYNFALTLDQVNSLWETDRIYAKDLGGKYVVAIEDQPAFENGTAIKEGAKLTDKLKDEQVQTRVNKATVKAKFKDDSDIDLNVTWQGLRQDGGKWYLTGTVDTSNLGYPSTLTGVQTVRAEVEVERATRKVTVTAPQNGTVTPDKEAAYLGDTVVFTVTPAEGYEVDKVVVNGVVLMANEDGTYSYTVQDSSDVKVEATFKAANKTDEGGGTVENGGKKSKLGLWIGLGVGGAVVLAGAAVAVVLFMKKKNKK